MIIATPPVPLSLLSSVVERDSGGVVLLTERREGEWEEKCDILPGTPAVEGIRFNRARSVGGLGAGPGFINWPGP